MSLEVKRKELELAKVEVARKDLEFKVEENLAYIEHLQKNIKIQLEKEQELKQIIQELKKG